MAARSRYRALVPEIASRVYTRDGLSDNVELLMPRQQGEGVGVTVPCQKSRGACTHRLTFLAFVDKRGLPLSEIPSRVYTQVDLSGIRGQERSPSVGDSVPCVHAERDS